MKPNYTAVVLTAEARNLLLERFSHLIPCDWEKIAHHCTLNMGEARDKALLGKARVLRGDAMGFDPDLKVMALRITHGAEESVNAATHVTIAVDRAAGGKPVHSYKIVTWLPVGEVLLSGIIEECC